MKSSKLFVPKETDEMRAWRKYAAPYNNHLVNRTKQSIWLDNSIPMRVTPKKTVKL